MTATSRKNANETAGHTRPAAAKGIFDEVILDEWLLSDPAPGTFSQFKNDYTALHHGKTAHYHRVQRHGSTP